jgi:hypothetical protein
MLLCRPLNSNGLNPGLQLNEVPIDGKLHKLRQAAFEPLASFFAKSFLMGV